MRQLASARARATAKQATSTAYHLDVAHVRVPQPDIVALCQALCEAGERFRDSPLIELDVDQQLPVLALHTRANAGTLCGVSCRYAGGASLDLPLSACAEEERGAADQCQHRPRNTLHYAITHGTVSMPCIMVRSVADVSTACPVSSTRLTNRHTYRGGILLDDRLQRCFQSVCDARLALC